MPIKVILADDHQVLRDSLADVLAKDPALVVLGQAGDGREALQLSRQLIPDVVVMDINMPQLNGIEATRQITLDMPNIQVIILSMYANKEHIYQAFQAGARGYLLKETSVQELVEAIKSVASGGRFLSQTLTETVIDEYFLKRGGESLLSPLDSLSSRERQIFQLVAEGKSSKEIASSLHLAESTVSTYRSRLMKKLEVEDLSGLIRFAIQHRIIDAD